MSSNDQYNRSNRQRQAPASADPTYDDDVLYEDEWDINSESADPPSRRQVPRNPKPGQPVRARLTPGAPTVDGTAAQLDRLRRNIRHQSARPATPSRGHSTRRPRQQASRFAPGGDDQVRRDDPYVDDQIYEVPAPLRTGRSRPATTTSTRRQPAARPSHADRIDTSDAEPYGEYDEFDYEDDFSEYDAPRRPARQARPRPQFTMPNLSRPTLPPAIARADLVNDAPALGIIGIGLASLAAMAIVVANQAESLAPEFATHVSASGILESFRDDSALWNLPLMAGAFTLMNIVMAWFISPLDRFASRLVLVGALVAQFVAWVAIFRIL